MRSAPSELARSALDAAPDAMLIIDSCGVILFANQQMSALFGYEHDAIIGRSIEQLMPERFRARHVGHRDQYVRNLRVRPMGAGLDLFARRRDGTEFPVEISLSPITDGEHRLIAAAIRDTTERNRAKAEIIAAREAAERAREAADRAREMADHAREIADRANQGKSRFLATASHDLRQPLQTLALLNGSLRRLIGDPSAQEAIAQQELAIGAMSRLLNALLDISKLESGAIQPEPAHFKVAGLFEDLRQEFGGMAAKKGLELQLTLTSDCVYSDVSLVEQILRNLLSNAIKYTREGRVLLHCLREQEKLVRIEVLDTGIGIPADQLPLIYDEFYQVGVPTNSTRDGYGLGLGIVQRLVKLLNLGFEVRSEVGKGSVFALVLPAGVGAPDPAPAAPQEQPKVRPQPARAHILLVEDDLGVRDATRMLLKVEGYRVSAVASLAEALRKAQEDRSIDLLLTDYHLGTETGAQVITALRATLGRHVKAVLMTGDTSSAIHELPLDLDVRVASKPIKADELLRIIRELLID